jgi:UDP-glucose 4-epimerase
MKVLVSGGAGYIGSTTCSALLDNGHVPVILDSLATGREPFTRGRIFYKGDIADGRLVSRIISEHPDLFCAIHFAALVVVPDSVSNPCGYYRENVAKSLEFYMNLANGGVKRVLFSSSASIYGNAQGVATETTPPNPQSPYARTKRMMEEILEDYAAAYGMKGIALRYFNPIGADPKMRTGMPLALPSHVLGKLISAASGKEPEFLITGTQWPTRDGTGIRDYVHVWDLALAHVKAVEQFDSVFEKAGDGARGGFLAINLGSGNGVTVKEIVAAFETV